MATRPTGETKSDARLGMSAQPKGKLLASLTRSLVHKWALSKSRTVAIEFYNLPSRIAAILGDPFLKYGPGIPGDPRNVGQMPFHQACIYGLSCSEDITQLTRKHEWMSPLDQQLAAEAHQLGAAWAFRTCKEIDDKEPVQPCRKDTSQ